MSWKKICSMLLAAMTVFSVLTVSTSAQSVSGSGLQISPVRKELTIEQGASQKITFTIRNITKGGIKTITSIEDFEPDISGSPKLLTDGEHNAQSIRNFVSSVPSVELLGGENKAITATVSVPQKTAPGAYYGVLRIQAEPLTTEKGGNVALTASVGAIILVEVPGQVTEKMQLAGTTALHNGKPSNIFASAPDQMRVEIRNAGNSFLKPYGTVRIADMSGKEVFSYQLNAVEPRSNVLPGSSRYFIDGIKNATKPGRYKVTTSVSYGSGGDVLTSQTNFWVLPLWLAAAFGGVVLLLIGLVLYLKRRFKRPLRHHSR